MLVYLPSTTAGSACIRKFREVRPRVSISVRPLPPPPMGEWGGGGGGGGLGCPISAGEDEAWPVSAVITEMGWPVSAVNEPWLDAVGGRDMRRPRSWVLVWCGYHAQGSPNSKLCETLMDES